MVCIQVREVFGRVHIPDGYLSPKTCAVFYAVMSIVWYFVFRAAGRTFKGAKAPFFAFGAAFVFVVMMLNFPVPGGTTGHIIGTPVLAIALGPYAAMAAVTIALLLQAVVFADGGISTFAANAFTMALVMSVVSHHAFRLFNGHAQKRAGFSLAAFFAGYLAVAASSFVAAFILGIQPLLGVSADGVPLYAPYGLEITLPAVMVPHLLIIAVVEGAATALIVPYLGNVFEPTEQRDATPKLSARIISALIVLVFLTPIGLLAPGTSWGEWGVDEIRQRLGYVPEGMGALSGLWRGLLPDYSVVGIGQEAGYVVSAAVGTVILLVVIYYIERKRHNE